MDFEAPLSPHIRTQFFLYTVYMLYPILSILYISFFFAVFDSAMLWIVNVDSFDARHLKIYIFSILGFYWPLFVF